MNTKLLAFFLAIGLAGTCIVNAHSPSPTGIAVTGKTSFSQES